MRPLLTLLFLAACSPGGATDAGVEDAGTTVSCGDAVLAPGVTCEVLGGPLLAPRDVLVTHAGDIVVTEMGAGRIVRLVGDAFAPIATGLASPIGIREASDGTLLVAEEDAHTVARIDAATGARTVLASGLPSVTYLALDAAGTIYVSSFGMVAATASGAVLRVDPTTGAVTPRATGMNVPEGLFVAADGSLVVAEWFDPSAVRRFAPSATLVGDASVVATGFTQIYGLIPDGAGGVLVGDEAGRIVRVRADGTQLVLLDHIGRPGGMAREATGALLVAEFVDFGTPGRVFRLRAPPDVLPAPGMI